MAIWGLQMDTRYCRLFFTYFMLFWWLDKSYWVQIHLLSHLVGSILSVPRTVVNDPSWKSLNIACYYPKFMLHPLLSLTLFWSRTIYFGQKTLHGSSADKISLKHVIYFRFWKLRGGGGSRRPYWNKTTLCTGFFFCVPLGLSSEGHTCRKVLTFYLPLWRHDRVWPCDVTRGHSSEKSEKSTGVVGSWEKARASQTAAR
jgi:hypothetical protein